MNSWIQPAQSAMIKVAQQSSQGSAALISMFNPKARHIQVIDEDGTRTRIIRDNVETDRYGNTIESVIRAMPVPCTIEMFLDRLKTMLSGQLVHDLIMQSAASVGRSVNALRMSSNYPSSNRDLVAADTQNYARFQADVNDLCTTINTSIPFFHERGVGAEIIEAAGRWLSTRVSGPGLDHLLTTSNAPAEMGLAQVNLFHNSASAYHAYGFEQAVNNYKQSEESEAAKRASEARVAELSRQIELERQRASEIEKAHQAEVMSGRQKQAQLQHHHSQFSQLMNLSKEQADEIQRLKAAHQQRQKTKEWEVPGAVKQAWATVTGNAPSQKPKPASCAALSDD